MILQADMGFKLFPGIIKVQAGGCFFIWHWIGDFMISIKKNQNYYL